MSPPLQHLDDCAGNHYRLQLNVYKWILQEYYGYTVGAMRVVCCHPDNEGVAFVDDVPDMQNEVCAIMEIQRSWATEVRRMENEDWLSSDPLGGVGSQPESDDLERDILRADEARMEDMMEADLEWLHANNGSPPQSQDAARDDQIPIQGFLGIRASPMSLATSQPPHFTPHPIQTLARFSA